MNKLKQKLLHYLLKDYFNAITEDDILWQDKQGKFYIGDTELSEEQVVHYKNFALKIHQNPTWHQILKDMKHLANKKIYQYGSDDELSSLFGKVMLHCLYILETKFKKLSK